MFHTGPLLWRLYYNYNYYYYDCYYYYYHEQNKAKQKNSQLRHPKHFTNVPILIHQTVPAIMILQNKSCCNNETCCVCVMCV